MKVLIPILIGLLVVGCGGGKQLTLEEKVVGDYEAKEEGVSVRVNFLENGVSENYFNGKKEESETKWKIVDGEIHVENEEGGIGIFIINTDGNLAAVAHIDKDGKRKGIPLEEQLPVLSKMKKKRPPIFGLLFFIFLLYILWKLLWVFTYLSGNFLSWFSDRKTVKRLRRLAEQGDATAQHSLGLMYHRGEGVLKDDVVAYVWLKIASVNGQKAAVRKRRKIAKRMKSKQIARAMELYEEMESEKQKNHKIIEKVFSCNLCGQEFVSKNKLFGHLKEFPSHKKTGALE